MAKTIIQTIGPLYGEVVNGTVFGRPNGSVFVPSSNTILATLADNLKYVRIFAYGWGSRVVPCTSAGNVSPNYSVRVVAEAQDIQSYISVSVEDQDGNVVGSPWVGSAGNFNLAALYLGTPGEGDAIVNEDPYEVVATLYSSNGVAVATARISVTGVSE